MTLRLRFLIALFAALSCSCTLDWDNKKGEKNTCQDGGCSDSGAGDPGSCFADRDRDGHGDPKTPRSCEADDVSTLSDDCDDAEPNAFGSATELCDTIDNDCDDTVDEDIDNNLTFYRDADGDRHGVATETSKGCRPEEGSC